MKPSDWNGFFDQNKEARIAEIKIQNNHLTFAIKDMVKALNFYSEECLASYCQHEPLCSNKIAKETLAKHADLIGKLKV